MRRTSNIACNRWRLAAYMRPTVAFAAADRREIRIMAGIGQGWTTEAIPTRDDATLAAARLLRSILLLTSP